MRFFLEKYIHPVLVAVSVALAVGLSPYLQSSWPLWTAVTGALVLIAFLVGRVISRTGKESSVSRRRWFPFGRVPLADAARLMHEAMEKEGIAADIAGQSYSSPDVHLSYSKYVFMTAAKEGQIRLFGKRLPSHRRREIPADKMSQLRPVEGEPNSLWSLSRSSPLDYYDVEISRWDLNKAIRYRTALVKRVDAALRRHG